MDHLPLVSVCVPTFNRADYLCQCLASVRAQSYRCIEVVVSDNCSTDGTRAMLAAMPDLAVVLQERNLGMVGNWNAVVGRARGELVVVLSDDDILLPTFIEAMVQALRDPEVEFAWCPVVIIDHEGKARGTTAAGPSSESGRSFVAATLAQRRMPYPSAIAFRREAVSEIGGFADIGNQADVAFRIALAERRRASRVVCHPLALVEYRVHAASLSDDRLRRIDGRLNFLVWLIDRYGPGSRAGRMALVDLLQMRAQGVAIFARAQQCLDRPGGGWFGARFTMLARGARVRRAVVLAAFPLLALSLITLHASNRLFRKRHEL
jgi:glycosyltransferase involved in cell wall biosynthesis